MVLLAQMVEFIVKPLSEPCRDCDDGREVAFSYEDDLLSVRSASYHHEYRDLLTFAQHLRTLEQRRTGSAVLFSKAEDSIFRLGFARTGGELQYFASHVLRFHPDGAEFGESVRYFGEIPSESVGQFLSGLIREIEKANQTVLQTEANRSPQETNRTSSAAGSSD
jgi:ATP-dependent RNA circularization protein (DNA/RNA ligase family)